MMLINVRRIKGRGRITAANRLRDVSILDTQSVEYKRGIATILATHNILIQ